MGWQARSRSTMPPKQTTVAPDPHSLDGPSAQAIPERAEGKDDRASLRTPQDVSGGLGAFTARARRFHLARFSGLYLWALIILIFAIAIPNTFLTSTTADN